MSDPTAPLPSRPELVQLLVEACLDRMEHEGPQAVEQVCALHPEHAAAIRKRLKWLSDAGLLQERADGSGA